MQVSVTSSNKNVAHLFIGAKVDDQQLKKSAIQGIMAWHWHHIISTIMENKEQPKEQKVEIFAEAPGTAPSISTVETAATDTGDKTGDAEPQPEEQKQDAKAENIQKSENSGEAG